LGPQHRPVDGDRAGFRDADRSVRLVWKKPADASGGPDCFAWGRNAYSARKTPDRLVSTMPPCSQ